MPNEAQPSVAQELSLKEIQDRHPGRWLLVQISEFDDRRIPLKGKLVVEKRTYEATHRVLEKLPLPSKQEPPVGPYIVVWSPGRRGFLPLQIIERFVG